MTSVRHLKFAAGAGEPDAVPARRIDVVAAAEEWQRASVSGDYERLDKSEFKLDQAVRRYRNAVRDRGRMQ